MRAAIWRIASTAPEVEFCTARMWLAISSVAVAVCTASDLTSEATTAKPLPASPARAASIVALSASRLVCSAILRISLTTSPIFCAPEASPAISPSVERASSVASCDDVAGMSELAADLGDGMRQFVGRDRRGLHIGGSLVERLQGAFGALRGLVGGAEQGARGRAHGGRAAAHAGKQFLRLRPERGNRAVDGRAPLLLVADCGAFLFGLALFGDVLMGGDPSAARQHLVLGQHDAPIAGLHINLHILAFGDAIQES